MELIEDYNAERISQENLVDFINIHRDAFKSKISIDFQKKKFNTIPIAGVEYIGYMVYHLDETPVAYYGVFPLYGLIDKKKVLISQSGDTMTKPNHAGRGLFPLTAKLTYNLCIENHIKGVFGFPSPPSFPSFKKRLDWTFVNNLKKYNFFVPTIPLAFISQKSRVLQNIHLSWVKLILVFYKKADFFEGSVTGNGQNGVYRDEAFWKYKMNFKNNFACKIGETSIVFKANGMFRVGDVNIDNKSDIKPILRKLKWLSFLTFHPFVMFCVSPGSVLDIKLNGIKKSTEGLPIGYLNFDKETDLSSLKFTYFDFDTF